MHKRTQTHILAWQEASLDGILIETIINFDNAYGTPVINWICVYFEKDKLLYLLLASKII